MTSRCGRCGKKERYQYPLDAVVHPFDGSVCEGCLKDTDTVVDV